MRGVCAIQEEGWEEEEEKKKGCGGDGGGGDGGILREAGDQGGSKVPGAGRDEVDDDVALRKLGDRHMVEVVIEVGGARMVVLVLVVVGVAQREFGVEFLRLFVGFVLCPSFY